MSCANYFAFCSCVTVISPYGARSGGNQTATHRAREAGQREGKSFYYFQCHAFTPRQPLGSAVQLSLLRPTSPAAFCDTASHRHAASLKPRRRGSNEKSQRIFILFINIWARSKKFLHRLVTGRRGNQPEVICSQRVGCGFSSSFSAQVLSRGP